MTPRQAPQPPLPPGQDRWASAASAARWALAALLLASGLHKAAGGPEEFAAVLETYDLLPQAAIMPFAVVLPWLEVLLGLSLAAGYAARAAAAGAGLMFLTFIGALGSTLFRGMKLDNCGCFGAGVHLSPPQAMGLDAVLASLAVFVFLRKGGCWKLDDWVEAGDPS